MRPSDAGTGATRIDHCVFAGARSRRRRGGETARGIAYRVTGRIGNVGMLIGGMLIGGMPIVGQVVDGGRPSAGLTHHGADGNGCPSLPHQAGSG